MPVTVTTVTANNWGDCPFPFVFFADNAEEERPEKAFCKVYNDGGHYVAVPYFEGKSKRKRREIRERTALQEQFDSLFSYALAAGLEEDPRREFLRDNLCHLFDDENELEEFITEQEERNNTQELLLKLQEINNKLSSFSSAKADAVSKEFLGYPKEQIENYRLIALIAKGSQKYTLIEERMKILSQLMD